MNDNVFSYLTQQQQADIKKIMLAIDNEYSVEAAYELAKINVSYAAIIAALLSQENLEEYGDINEETLFIISSLKKVKSIQAIDEQSEKESYRELFIAMSKNIDVILVELALELVKLRHEKARTTPEIQHLAGRAKTVYGPLAHRLGLGEMKSEFEDLSLYVLDNESFFEIAKKLELKKVEREQLVEKMIEELTISLKKVSDNIEIIGRSKHIYSIYNKMHKQQKKFEEIYDLLALRILCQTEEECYAILGEVHQKYPPIMDRFKDYIARPKPNLYQSLHTAVLGEKGKIFEIQIRTHKMDEIAELGVAAHFQYKEGKKKQKAVADQLMWFRDFISITNENEENNDYVDLVKKDIFDTNIYILTPQKKIITLPKDSTIIDFAFKIHSKVGEKMVGAIVNGQIVSYSYKLQTTDVVEILTKKNAPGPNEMWLEIATTTQAKTKIRKILKKKIDLENEERIIAVKNSLFDHIKAEKIDKSILNDSKKMAAIRKYFNCKSNDQIYLEILNKKITIGQVIEQLKGTPKEQVQKIKFAQEKVNKNIAIVSGAEDIKTEVAKCCLPIPGDEICSTILNGRSLKVHRKNCINVVNETNVLDAYWNENISSKSKTKLIVELDRTNNNTNAVIQTLFAQNIEIIKFNTKNNKDLTVLDFVILVQNTEVLETATVNLQKIKEVVSVKRG